MPRPSQQAPQSALGPASAVTHRIFHNVTQPACVALSASRPNSEEEK
jgi:hypothetical protein